MKPLNSFVSFTVPLIVMLLTFALYLLINDVASRYKHNIENDYSIVVITNTPFKKPTSLAGIDIKDIQIIRREKIIEGLENKLSDTSLEMIKVKMPYFYKIYLQEFPTTLKLEQIRKELNTISNVKKVETFSSNHNKIYSILVLVQDIMFVFFLIVLALSILLLSKQIKIWFYEHSQRISIIQLHGGTLFYASKPIFKIIFSSAFSASIVVCGVSYFAIMNIDKIVQPEIISLMPKIVHFQLQLVYIAILAFIIPTITFLGLLIKYKTR